MSVSSAVVVGGSLNAVHWGKHLVDIHRCYLRVAVHPVTLVVVLVNMVLFAEMTLPLYFILPYLIVINQTALVGKKSAEDSEPMGASGSIAVISGIKGDPLGDGAADVDSFMRSFPEIRA